MDDSAAPMLPAIALGLGHALPFGSLAACQGSTAERHENTRLRRNHTAGRCGQPLPLQPQKTQCRRHSAECPIPRAVSYGEVLGRCGDVFPRHGEVPAPRGIRPQRHGMRAPSLAGSSPRHAGLSPQRRGSISSHATASQCRARFISRRTTTLPLPHGIVPAAQKNRPVARENVPLPRGHRLLTSQSLLLTPIRHENPLLGRHQSRHRHALHV